MGTTSPSDTFSKFIDEAFTFIIEQYLPKKAIYTKVKKCIKKRHS